MAYRTLLIAAASLLQLLQQVPVIISWHMVISQIICCVNLVQQRLKEVMILNSVKA